MFNGSNGLPLDRHYVCIYFTIIKNSRNAYEKNGEVREYILKYLAKREAINKGTTRSRIAGMTLTDSKRLLYP